MAIEAAAAATDTSIFSTKPTTAGKRTEVTRQQFLDLLVAELAHQDPMEPLKNEDFMNQLVQLSSMESTAALTDGIKQLVLHNQISSSANLIGKMVHGVAESGKTVVGRVDRIRVEGNQVLLLVNGEPVRVDKISEILSMDGDGSVTSGNEGVENPEGQVG